MQSTIVTDQKKCKVICFQNLLCICSYKLLLQQYFAKTVIVLSTKPVLFLMHIIILHALSLHLYPNLYALLIELIQFTSLTLHDIQKALTNLSSLFTESVFEVVEEQVIVPPRTRKQKPSVTISLRKSTRKRKPVILFQAGSSHPYCIFDLHLS